MKISFTVPFAAVQQRPRLGKGGHVYSPSKKEQKIIGQYALVARGSNLPMKGQVGLILIVYGLRGDLSNCIKIVEDAMNGVIYIDDRQIKKIGACSYEDDEEPRMEITVEEFK
jgi:Holliday junction resolvase RusA-like endonuclease